MALDISTKSFGQTGKKISLLFPVVIVFSLLFVYFLSDYFKKIDNSLKTIKNTKVELEQIRKKIDSLRLLNSSSYEKIELLSLAFPDDEPILFMLSQMKKLILEKEIEVDSIGLTLGAESSKEINLSSITLSCNGSEKNLSDFLYELPKIAPLNGIKNISFDKYFVDDNKISADITIDIYFSPMPTTLGEAQISNILSPSEEEVYKKLINLKMPDFDIEPQKPSDQITDPFSFSASPSASLSE